MHPNLEALPSASIICSFGFISIELNIRFFFWQQIYGVTISIPKIFQQITYSLSVTITLEGM